MMSQITDQLFLSGANGFTPASLVNYGIGHVINTTLEIPLVSVPGIECTRVPVNDITGEDIYRFFDLVVDKMHLLVSHNIKVLVHCVAGVSRSASFVLAYLVKWHQLSLRDAYKFLHSKRPIVRPNSSFFKQLIEYERKLFGTNSVAMATVRSFDNQEIEVPDLYVNEYKKMALLEMVVRRRNKLVKERLCKPSLK
ncbi:Dual specificity protein phosphatase 14 [Halotydeus destructor]|nr:Dual specificity protein phosphatase 14 [Halotydeus destructor]